MSINFHQNLHVYVKTSAKNTIFTLFVFSPPEYLVNGLSLNAYFFLLTLTDPVKNSAVNAEAPFFRGTVENVVVMTKF